MNQLFETQLESVISEYADARSKSQNRDASDILGKTEASDLRTRCLAAIERIAGKSSVYYEQATDIKKGNSLDQLAMQIGVAKSLLGDAKNGYLKSLAEIIHSDVFTDYLEMSDHLNDSGYKDAAAVITGSTLEAHLKQLCQKHGVSTENNGRAKKASVFNADLAKVPAYSKTDAKSITAWLGLRNDAAHGDYSKYNEQQVRLLTSSVRDFVTRNPA